jgi:hypothetical protein
MSPFTSRYDRRVRVSASAVFTGYTGVSTASAAPDLVSAPASMEGIKSSPAAKTAIAAKNASLFTVFFPEKYAMPCSLHRFSGGFFL